eukprot:3458861-Rhodomonas_salina.1
MGVKGDQEAEEGTCCWGGCWGAAPKASPKASATALYCCWACCCPPDMGAATTGRAGATPTSMICRCASPRHTPGPTPGHACERSHKQVGREKEERGGCGGGGPGRGRGGAGRGAQSRRCESLS